jgi:hypothetical protein
MIINTTWVADNLLARSQSQVPFSTLNPDVKEPIAGALTHGLTDVLKGLQLLHVDIALFILSPS